MKSALMNTGQNQESKGDFLEEVGKEVLQSWAENSQIGITLSDPPQKLLYYLSLPDDKLPIGWEHDFQNIAKTLTPVDFALYGQRITSFLLRNMHVDRTKIKQKKHYKRISVRRFKSYQSDDSKNTSQKCHFPKWLPTLDDSD